MGSVRRPSRSNADLDRAVAESAGSSPELRFAGPECDLDFPHDGHHRVRRFSAPVRKRRPVLAGARGIRAVSHHRVRRSLRRRTSRPRTADTVVCVRAPIETPVSPFTVRHDITVRLSPAIPNSWTDTPHCPPFPTDGNTADDRRSDRIRFPRSNLRPQRRSIAPDTPLCGIPSDTTVSVVLPEFTRRSRRQRTRTNGRISRRPPEFSVPVFT